MYEGTIWSLLHQQQKQYKPTNYTKHSIMHWNWMHKNDYKTHPQQSIQYPNKSNKLNSTTTNTPFDIKTHKMLHRLNSIYTEKENSLKVSSWSIFEIKILGWAESTFSW